MKWAIVALLVLVLMGLGLKWVIEERARTAPSEPTVNVQSAWEVYRRAPGHEWHVGQLKLDCAACHQQVDGGADKPGPERCATCHAQQSTLQHAQGHGQGDASSALSRCTACHGFGPDPEQAPGDCLRCHAEAQGPLPAVTVHAADDCLSCHQPHEDRVEARECAECHDVQVQHGKVRAGGREAACTSCHDPHAEAEIATERCASCHGAQGLAPVPATAGHAGQGCAACHSDHRFTKAGAKTCTSCHTDQHALPGRGHRECVACHDPHALEPVQAAVTRCVDCHRSVRPSHGRVDALAEGDAGPTDCTACHHAHPSTKQAARVRCTECHELASAEDAAHAGDVACIQCHLTHDFDRDAAVSCKTCHAKRLTTLSHHKGHSDCASCHSGLPHLAGRDPATCASCHAEQAGAVSQGHAPCTKCHEPHAKGAPRAACASCHVPQAAAVGHGHAVCANCHETHSGAPKPGVEDCSSCHQAKRLPGLHRELKHQSCSTCHAVHAEGSPATRATCLSCHEAQRDHQPDAPVCNGCHTFRGPGVRRPR